MCSALCISHSYAAFSSFFVSAAEGGSCPGLGRVPRFWMLKLAKQLWSHGGDLTLLLLRFPPAARGRGMLSEWEEQRGQPWGAPRALLPPRAYWLTAHAPSLGDNHDLFGVSHIHTSSQRVRLSSMEPLEVPRTFWSASQNRVSQSLEDSPLGVCGQGHQRLDSPGLSGAGHQVAADGWPDQVHAGFLQGPVLPGPPREEVGSSPRATVPHP